MSSGTAYEDAGCQSNRRIEGGPVRICDLNRALDWSLPDEEATTVAGLVIHEVRQIPEQGQEFTFHGYRFKVLRKARNRISQLRVAPIRPATPDLVAGGG